MRHGLAIVAAICAFGLIGCSGQTASAPATDSSTPPTAQDQGPEQTAGTGIRQPQPIEVPASARPDEVVSTFLDAIRRGDSATTEALLTNKAQEELAKHDFAVVPQATPNMQFQILGTQTVGDASGAHVTCRWTERYEDGDQSYDVTWVLRRQAEGWRVAGLAMQLIPDQQPQFLNFEDVADMERKKDEAMEAMQPPAVETAQQPLSAAEATGQPIER
jgi:ketosteroid isomerase-like protein